MNRDMFGRRELLLGGVLAAGAGMASRLMAADEVIGSGLPKLKITKVTTYLLETPLKQPFGPSVSIVFEKTRSALLVKVETDEGIVGWGETAPINGARGTIVEVIAPMLIGKNPLERRKLWRSMWGANFGNALAVGAVDMALDDIRGKALGMPLAELYGGRIRDRVLAYASGMNYQQGMEPEEHYINDAVNLVRSGFKAIKMRLGRYPVAREAKFIAEVRRAVGPEIKLMADGNGAYTMKTALEMADVLRQNNFEFWEEPLPQAPNYTAYDKLREKMPLPLAGGEVLDSRMNAAELIRKRGVDIIQPDASLCGGIGEVLFISELAAMSGIQTIPHSWGCAILIAATTHLVSLIHEPHYGFTPNPPMIEIDQGENPWRTEIVKAPVEFKEGYVTVPTAPGIGVEVIEEAVERYSIKTE